jgi:hypothetical protein
LLGVDDAVSSRCTLKMTTDILKCADVGVGERRCASQRDRTVRRDWLPKVVEFIELVGVKEQVQGVR